MKKSRHLLASVFLSSALAGAVLVAAPGPATAAAPDCQVVSTATTETDGPSYRGGPDDRWYTFYRTITSTTTLCGSTYTTELSKGPWISRRGDGEADNPGIAHEKALQLEVDRLHRIVDRLMHRIEHLRVALGWS